MTHTTTNAAPQPQKTMQEILRAIDETMAAPRLIGGIGGMPVYVDGRLPDRMVEVRSKDQTVRFRADHPYLDGTKFAAAVRRS